MTKKGYFKKYEYIYDEQENIFVDGLCAGIVQLQEMAIKVIKLKAV